MNRTGWYVRRYAKFMLVIMAVILVRTALTFAGPLIVREILDGLAVSRTQNLALLFALFLGAFALLSLSDVVYDSLYARFSYVLKTAESRNLYRELFKVNYGFVRMLDPTYYVARVKESVDHVFALIGEGVVKAAISLVTIAASLLLIYGVDVRLFALFAALLPLNVICYRSLNKRLLQMSTDLQQTCAENFKNLVNVMQGFEDIKQLANYASFAEVVGKYVDTIETKNRRAYLFARLSFRVIELAIGLVKNGILLLSIYFFVKGRLGFAEVMFINMVLGIYFTALSDLNGTNLNLRDVRASFRFIRDEILSQREQTGGDELGRVGAVEFAVESFGYTPESDVLNDFRLRIRAGEKVALVGRTGCGKSTIAKMLTRLYETPGLLINGQSAGEISLQSLRKRIYVVTQNTFLFPGSLKDNIVIGLDCYDCSRLERVLTLPFLADLAGLSEGFSTMVREGGSNLSGGQKQKIAIARMLMHDPDFVIFDESTSAMDSRTESEMWESIREFLNGKTVMSISHRLSTIREADRIVIMTNGRVACAGSYNELLSGCEEFRALFAGQIG